MSTPIFTCGAECRVVPVASAPAPVHWTLTGTAPTIDTTIFRRGGGSASFKWTGTGSTQSLINHTIAQKSWGARFYVYFGAFPSAVVSICNSLNANGNATLKINSAGALLIRAAGSAADVTVATLATNRWYLVDWKADATGATMTTTIRVDGTSETSDSHVQVSANFTSFVLGPNVFGDVATAPTIYFDDVIVGALADYPWGDGYVVGYRVNDTSGTHNQTAGDFQNDAGTNITNGDGSGAKLNELTPDTTSFIKEVALGTAGGYVEYVYNTALVNQIPRAVEQLVAVKNVSLTTANNEKSQLYDGTTASDAYALTSIGATTLVYRSKQWANPPSGGAWTTTLARLLRIRWGFSTDNSPVPALTDTIVEMEFDQPPPRNPAINFQDPGIF